MNPGSEHAAVAARLRAAGCVAAEEEAGELVAAAPDAATLQEWVARRERGEPLAWITGSTVFCGNRLHVEPGVFVPRWHTETLAIRAAERLPTGGRACDLCTGCGAVAVRLGEVAGVRVVAADRDPAAVRCARRNGVVAVIGDAGACFASDSFDVVTAVAPYVPTGELQYLPRDVRAHEPVNALDGGDDGLAIVRTVIADAARILHSGGSVVLELGGHQLAAVTHALLDAGFAGIDAWADAHGDLRGVSAVLERTREVR